jgi:hypothetical protein
VQEFEDFQKHLQWTLNDFSRAIGEMLPTARVGASGASGHSTCLSCDHQVQSSLEISRMLAAGHLPERSSLRKRAELSLSPESLPSSAPLPKRCPISAADPLGVLSAVAVFNVDMHHMTQRHMLPKLWGAAGAKQVPNAGICRVHLWSYGRQQTTQSCSGWTLPRAYTQVPCPLAL